MTALGIGLLGMGTVGSAVVERLQAEPALLASRAGAPLRLVRAAVRDPSRPRPVDLPAELLTGDARAVVEDPGVDIVVEAMGGVEPAAELIATALDTGRSVVTANKEVMSTRGEGLGEIARRRGVDLLFGASVGGGVPMIEMLRGSLRADRVTRLDGVLNGTCNFILQRMSEEGDTLAAAISLAQARGYAEADPSADVDGWDATYKLCILAAIAWGARVDPGEVPRRGIRGVDLADVERSRSLGFEMKLLASASREGDRAQMTVRPALVPAGHPLAGIRGAGNGLVVSGDMAGPVAVLGAGAGGRPTGSAVMSDVVTAARRRVSGTSRPPEDLRSLRLLDPEEAETAAYLRVELDASADAADLVVQALEDRGVHVLTAVRDREDADEMLVLTDTAPDAVISRAVETLETLACVTAVAARHDVIGEVP